MTSIIEIRDVSFHYTPEQLVLQGVTLTIEPGTTAVVGQNGAGKTTLMKLLNGLLQPTAGEIRVGGLCTADHGTHEIAKRVGLIFQNPNDQIFKSTVLAEVMFGPLNVGMSEAEAKDSALSALAMVELEHAVDDNPYDLSFAMRKRICIASILAMQTDVVVFDEPTISQDAVGLQLISSVIERLKAAGKTVIAIVHDMNFAAENFDRVIAMAQGQVVADGTPQDVFLDESVLKRSHVDAPSMLKLSRALGLMPMIDVHSVVGALRAKPESGQL